MAEKAFQLQILTPRRTVFSGAITSLIVPAVLGYLGVWANHAPLVATLTSGKITFRDTTAQTKTLQSHAEGLLEVYHNRATLLLDEIAE